MVLSASPSIAGLRVIAPSAEGGSAMPPAAMRSFSRAAMPPAMSCEGATPITPMNGAPGMRTPGISSQTAPPACCSHLAQKGSLKTSRRKPKPGRERVKP